MEKARRYKSFIISNNIRSSANVGSLFRIAESLDMGLILQGITPHPKTKDDTRLPYIIKNDTKKITKTAVHSIRKVEWYYFKTVDEVLDFINTGDSAFPKDKKQSFKKYQKTIKLTNNLKRYKKTCDIKVNSKLVLEPKGITLYTLEQGIKNAINIYSKTFKVQYPFALVVGNEVNGVEDNFIKASKQILYLPMKGSQSSINVAVSAAVACFHLNYSQ